MACLWTLTGGNNNSSSNNSNNIFHNNNHVQNFRPILELPWECKLRVLGFYVDQNLGMTGEDPADLALVQEFQNPVEVRVVIEVSGHVCCLHLLVVTVRLPLPSLVHRPLKSPLGLHLRPDLIRRAGFQIHQLVWFLHHLLGHHPLFQIIRSNPDLDPKQRMRTRRGTLAKCVRSGFLLPGMSGFTGNPILENGPTFVTIVGKALCCLMCSKYICENVRRTIQVELDLDQQEWPLLLGEKSHQYHLWKVVQMASNHQAHHNFLTGFTKPHRYLNSKAFWKVAECLTMAVVPCTTKDMMVLPLWVGAWVACLHLLF